MRVLHVAQPTSAGVARAVSALVRDQVPRGWDVAVACPPGGELADAVSTAGARWLPWPAGRSPGPGVLLEAGRLRRLLCQVSPEVVHLHSSKAGLVGRLVLRGRVPTVFQPHAWSFLAVEGRQAALAARWERTGARWAQAVAVVSQDERAAGEQAAVSARWVHLPNGVDLAARPVASQEDRAAARRALGLPPGPLAVCVGRLCRQKGQDLLVRGWPRVAAAVPGAALVLVGDGPDAAGLAARTPHGVTLVGAVDDADPWLRAADVVVLPSRWEAGLSLVAMEAMALGRSVVSTCVAGAAEGIGDDAGAVVPVDDEDAVVQALVARLGDPTLTAAEGSAGRRRVEEHHDLRETCARTAELYLRLRG